MTSIAQAAAAASVIVGLISVPAVSKTAVNPSSGLSKQMPNVSANATTRKVTKTLGTDGFSASIRTAFSSFQTDINAQSAEASLQSPGSKLQVERSASKTVWKLSTSSGSLKIVQTPEKVVEVVETPQGTLKTTSSGGTISTSFEGADRAAVEESRRELKQLLQRKKAVLSRKRDHFSQSQVSEGLSVEIRANVSTASGFGNNSREHVILVNKGSELSLEGWKIANNNGNFVKLPERMVSEGDSIKIYSNKIDAEGITGTGLSWENGGDTVTLKNSEGAVVAEESY